MKYVILGGNGCFGINTAHYLLSKPDTKRVVCIGRNPEKPEPFTQNLGKEDPRYAYRQIHIVFEHDLLMDFLHQFEPDVIINYAAQGEGAASWTNCWRYFETNATALAKICEDLGRQNWMGHWIQIGTSELYGSVKRPADENHPVNPTSPYAASKLAGDHYLQSAKLSFPYNIIRPSNAYCPGQQLYRIIPRAVVCGLSGTKLPLHGGGTPRKSYIHGTDLSEAIYLVAASGGNNRVYNVGPENPTAIRDIVWKVADRVGLTLEQLCDITPARFGEDATYWLDSSAINKDLGWEPRTDLKDGITGMVDWGKQYLSQLVRVPQTYTFHA